MPEANELLEYWTDHPPAYVLLAARYGHEPRRKKKGSKTAEAEDLSMVFGMNMQKPPDYVLEAVAWAESQHAKKEELN